MKCHSCSGEIPGEARFCPTCGGRVRREGDLTITSVPVRSPAGVTASPGAGVTHAGGVLSSTSGDGRFLPGVMLADRYRIIGLLGRGGMGEVYRADDVKLGQPVALKFLPEAFHGSDDRLNRFLNEVRVARQVSHPNVCRVYDIGEIGGQHYLSMEFVDGEDLSSLLRRIGRLPADKAAQIARQICAGMAAAHRKGIVHRDLKPANVMIDGEGQVRITDFGLAGLAAGFAGAEIRVGTPAYMAPEQLAGKEVTERSDIYSLGLVLYELYTGKPAFKADTLAELTQMQQSQVPTQPSSLISDLDPAAERVILRCLEKDPQKRPDSAMRVAAALPGGDPLAAALEAGETPSPEMVAASGSDERVGPGPAWALLVTVVVGLLAAILLNERTSLIGRVKPDRPLPVLEAQARELIAELGYPGEPSDRVGGFSVDNPTLQFVERSSRTPGRWRVLGDAGQTALVYRYRQAEGPLIPRNFVAAVTLADPPPAPGDIAMTTALDGRLTGFRVRPQDVPSAEVGDGDWDALFAAARLDRAEFVEVEPGFNPRYFADERRTWCGTTDDMGGLPVRIEAAMLEGRPVTFDVVTPASRNWTTEEQPGSGGVRSLQIVLLVLAMLIVGGAVFLAVRNRQKGRGDVKGAFRVAGVIFFGRLLFWLFSGHHVASFAGEFYMIGTSLGFALLLALASWIFYMAVEPYARKLWPQSLVGWSRIIGGRLRDPVVGRELLVGAAFGAILAVTIPLRTMAPEWFGAAAPAPLNWGMAALEGGRYALGLLFLIPVVALTNPLMNYLLLLLLRIVLRRQVFAAIGFSLISILGDTAQLAGSGPTASFSAPIVGLGIFFGIVDAAIVIVLMTRYGLLATTGCFVVIQTFNLFPLTLDPSLPYFGVSLLGLAAPLAMTVFAFIQASSGRSLFQDRLLEGEAT